MKLKTQKSELGTRSRCARAILPFSFFLFTFAFAHPAQAAFPTVVGTRETQVTSNATSIAALLPNGSNVNGYLVIVFVSKDGTGTMTWPSGWTQLAEGAMGSSGQDGRLEARYRVIDGTEGFDGTDDSISVSGASEEWASWAMTISGQHSSGAPECASAVNSTGDADPPNLAPSWGAEETLWIAYSGWAAVVAFTASPYPANYSSNQFTGDTGGAGGITHASATRNLNAVSDDPGIFNTTSSSAHWRALTCAVRPAGAAPAAARRRVNMVH